MDASCGQPFRNRPYASATRIAGRIGVIFALLFAVVGVLDFNVIMILLALFIYGAATTESRTVLIDELLEGITVGDIMTRNPGTVEADATVAALVNRMIRERATIFPVTDSSGTIVGLVALADLRGLDQQERAETRVAEVMRDASRIPSTADAFDTLGLLGGAGGTFALVEENGVVTGVLSGADYAHALTIRRGFQSGFSG